MTNSITSFVPWTHFLGHLKLKSKFCLNGMIGDGTETLDMAAITVKKYSRVELI
jgi:hypothetical protein